MRTVCVAVVLSVLTVLLLVVAAFSLAWPMLHDSPIMLYLAYTMDEFGAVPYRDFFDMNTPGTYFAYMIAGHVFGYDDLGLRLADILCLAGLLTITFLLLRRIDRTVAWTGTVLFGLLYLARGSGMSFQREYLALLPVAGAHLAASSSPKVGRNVRAVVVGLLFGIAAAVKPHMAIAFPVVLWFAIAQPAGAQSGRPVTPRELWRGALLGIGGLAAVVVALALDLWSRGGLRPFLDIAGRYWPLYGQVTGDFEISHGLPRLSYLVSAWSRFGGRAPWIAAAALGAAVFLSRTGKDRAERRVVLLLIASSLLYAVYPVFAGKFWDYHWLPFLYFLVLLSALCFRGRDRNSGGIVEHWLPTAVLAFVILLTVRPPYQFRDQVRGRSPGALETARTREIAAFLATRLAPNDTVQPLDWTGGVVHAMLLARARPATRFVYDFHFYHHVSNGYIRELRERLIADLALARPRFVIQTETMRPWISGPESSRDFPELAGLLASNYAVALAGDGYVIYERRD